MAIAVQRQYRFAVLWQKVSQQPGIWHPNFGRISLARPHSSVCSPSVRQLTGVSVPAIGLRLMILPVVTAVLYASHAAYKLGRGALGRLPMSRLGGAPDVMEPGREPLSEYGWEVFDAHFGTAMGRYWKQRATSALR